MTGLFQDFHQKRLADNADDFSTGGHVGIERVRKKEKKYFFVPRAQAALSATYNFKPENEVAKLKTADNADDVRHNLPTACPLQTGIFSGLIVDICRFEMKLLKRMLYGGTLSLESGCPFAKLCRLMSVWPRAELLDSSHSNSPQVGRSDSGDSSPQEDGRPATSFCPARDQSTNLCYHNARFNGRSGGNNGNPCDPSRCPQKVESWKKIMEESLNENTDH